MRNLAAVVLVLVAGQQMAVPRETATPPTEVANNWLKLLDSGAYEKSWQDAGSTFQQNVTQEKWAESLRGARDAYGNLIARHDPQATRTKTLPGAPDGDYCIVQYQSQFAKKQAGTETVLLANKDGAWKVIGYFIR